MIAQPPTSLLDGAARSRHGLTKQPVESRASRQLVSVHADRLAYKIAASRHERLGVFRLVYDQYLQAGLIERNAYCLRVTNYHLEETTHIYTAVDGDEVVATLTLVGDGRLGLPMEAIYGDEVESRRRRGLSVSEVSALAMKYPQAHRSLPVFLRLTRLMAQHARSIGIHQLLVAIHPRHANYYERCLGFERFGVERFYPSVGNRPAVACCLDFKHIDTHRPPCWNQYFGTPVPRQRLKSQPMSAGERAYLRSLTGTANQHITMLAV